MNKLDELQKQIAEWARYNFPDKQSRNEALLGMIEELGELSHAVLKSHQGIRGTKEEHLEAMKDAIADMFVYCCQLCTLFDSKFSEFYRLHKDSYSSRDVRDTSLHQHVFAMAEYMGHFVSEVKSAMQYEPNKLTKNWLPPLINSAVEFLDCINVDFEQNLINVATEVLKRDWIKYPTDGRTY